MSDRIYSPDYVENIEPGDPQFWKPGNPATWYDEIFPGQQDEVEVGVNHGQAHQNGEDATEEASEGASITYAS